MAKRRRKAGGLDHTVLPLSDSQWHAVHSCPSGVVMCRGSTLQFVPVTDGVVCIPVQLQDTNSTTVVWSHFCHLPRIHNWGTIITAVSSNGLVRSWSGLNGLTIHEVQLAFRTPASISVAITDEWIVCSNYGESVYGIPWFREVLWPKSEWLERFLLSTGPAKMVVSIDIDSANTKHVWFATDAGPFVLDLGHGSTHPILLPTLAAPGVLPWGHTDTIVQQAQTLDKQLMLSAVDTGLYQSLRDYCYPDSSPCRGVASYDTTKICWTDTMLYVVDIGTKIQPFAIAGVQEVLLAGRRLHVLTQHMFITHIDLDSTTYDVVLRDIYSANIKRASKHMCIRQYDELSIAVSNNLLIFDD